MLLLRALTQMTPVPYEFNKMNQWNTSTSKWREACRLRNAATRHIEPPVTNQEVLMEQCSIWTQHGLSTPLIGTHIEHLKHDTSALQWLRPKDQQTFNKTDRH
jgi:hypothetical protein